jgi:hypothetical protein
MKWQIVADELPREEVLVWSDGRAVVAEFIPADRKIPKPLCINLRTEDILPWPTHWMPLPPPPGAASD